MGINKNEQLDAIWSKEMRAVGIAWARIDSVIHTQEEQGLMERTKISLKSRGGSWLLIIETIINGQKYVQFRDIGSVADAGKVVVGALADPTWKVQRPYGEENIGSIDKAPKKV